MMNNFNEKIKIKKEEEEEEDDDDEFLFTPMLI